MIFTFGQTLPLNGSKKKRKRAFTWSDLYLSHTDHRVFGLRFDVSRVLKGWIGGNTNNSQLTHKSFTVKHTVVWTCMIRWQVRSVQSGITQMSSWGPSYCCPSNTSGAAYGGLPHHVARGFPDWKKFPKPKSARMEKKEKGDIRMKLTGFTMSVFRDIREITFQL